MPVKTRSPGPRARSHFTRRASRSSLFLTWQLRELTHSLDAQAPVPNPAQKPGARPGAPPAGLQVGAVRKQTPRSP